MNNDRLPPDADLSRLRRQLVDVGARLYASGLVIASDGNLSLRVGEDHFLVTPSGLAKGDLRTEQLLLVDGQGRMLDPEGTHRLGLRATSELAMHLEAYRQRPDVGAVIHAHPPKLIAMSFIPGGLDAGILPEALLHLGLPPVLPYALPASDEGARTIREAIGQHDALVLSRHGSLTVGSDLWQAFRRTEVLEQWAQICWSLQAAGQTDLSTLRLSAARAGQLLAARRALGWARAGEEAEFRRFFGPSSEHP